MSYLQILQQARQQDADANARLWGALGGAALTFADLKLKGDERAKTQAQEQAKLFQQLGGVMLQSGQGKQAADLLPKFREAVKTGYGVDLPNTSVVGAPVMGQVPNPDFIGPMPLGQQAMRRGEVGRDFSGQQTLDTIRGGLMLEPPKPLKVEAGETYLDPVSKKVLFKGPDKPGKLVPSYNADGTITYREADEGLTVGARPAAPRLYTSYGPDGTATLVQGAAGVQLGARPAPAKDTQRAMARWQENKARFVEDYIKTQASRLPKTLFIPDPEGTGTIRLQNPISTTPTPEQIFKWRTDGGTLYEQSVPSPNVNRPFDQPGSGQAAPAVRGLRSNVITPPTSYRDTGLLPEWEKLAQQAAALSPGATISSRARSKERNAAAGGVDSSWHRYRQAFDLVVPRREDRPKLIQWGRQLGLEVIDEGDHLHFEPARSSDAMRNFYAKHGLESDDA